MSPRDLGITLSAAVVFAGATIVAGWWGPPFAAIVTVLPTSKRLRIQPAHLAVAGALAWAGLLGWAGLSAPVGALAARMAGLFGQPGWVLPFVTPLFAAGLVWSVATLTETLKNTKSEHQDG